MGSRSSSIQNTKNCALPNEWTSSECSCRLEVCQNSIDKYWNMMIDSHEVSECIPILYFFWYQHKPFSIQTIEHNLPLYFTWDMSMNVWKTHTVDGQNPAPLGAPETFYILGLKHCFRAPELAQDFFHQQYPTDQTHSIHPCQHHCHCHCHCYCLSWCHSQAKSEK